MKLKEEGYRKKAYLVEMDGIENLDEMEDNAPLYFEDQEAGNIIQKDYSYKATKFIALAYISEEVAWPGIEFESDKKSGGKVKLKTTIPPLFITNTILKAREE